MPEWLHSIFHESFIELEYSVSSKLENFNEKNGKQRLLDTEMQLLKFVKS